MKSYLFTVLVLASAISLVYAADINTAQVLPSDVVKFKEERDICEHWRGEEPYDDARAKAIEDAWQASCQGTDKALALLKNKYKNNPAVLKALANYEDTIE